MDDSLHQQFELVDTSHIPVVGYMEVVTTQNAATLLPAL